MIFASILPTIQCIFKRSFQNSHEIGIAAYQDNWSWDKSLCTLQMVAIFSSAIKRCMQTYSLWSQGWTELFFSSRFTEGNDFQTRSNEQWITVIGRNPQRLQSTPIQNEQHTYYWLTPRFNGEKGGIKQLV